MNYFETLFNMDKINPFTQFINGATLKGLKHKVRTKMDYYTDQAEKDESNEESKRGKGTTEDSGRSPAKATEKK